MASSGDPDTPQRLDHPYPLGCLSLITPLADNKRGQERKHTVKTTPPVWVAEIGKTGLSVCMCVSISCECASVLFTSNNGRGGVPWLPVSV